MSGTQYVTPELQRWLREQLVAGQSTVDLVKSMVTAGWQQKVALDAVAKAKLDGWFKKEEATPGVPEPDLRSGACVVDAGDRLVNVLTTVQLPRVVVFGNLLSDDECQAIIDAARPRMERSETVAEAKEGSEVNMARTSRGMFFERGEHPVVARVEARIAKLLNWPLENGEGFQVLNYKPGAEYKPHYDYFDPNEPGTPTILRRGGQRVATLVMYLNEPTRGGGTTFPDIGLEVAPVRGNAVFFSYERPHAGTKTLHGGAPVTAGEKWVATKWLREGVFA